MGENKIQIKVKSGFIAVVGRPNVGKSTLINSIIGQKIAAVSPRPQTTRKNQLGILTVTNQYLNAQIIFIDTPGIHRPLHKLGEKMNREAIETLENNDLILLIVDATQNPDEEDETIINLISNLNRNIPVIIALNKIDLLNDSNIKKQNSFWKKRMPIAEIIPISAAMGRNFDELLNKIIALLPEGMHFYPEDQVTDLYEREIAADLIRVSALKILRDEIPHGIAIRIDQYSERDENGAYIEATVFVERESHKAIVVGKRGKMIKKIGTTARLEIEKMSSRKIYLRLNVKVRKDWRNDEKVLRRFGY
ncbi:MAG: GTPase Era [Anaerolineales bacterium]|jgi:GTP-binding protein Era